MNNDTNKKLSESVARTVLMNTLLQNTSQAAFLGAFVSQVSCAQRHSPNCFWMIQISNPSFLGALMLELQILRNIRAHKFIFLLFKPRIKKVKEVINKLISTHTNPHCVIHHHTHIASDCVAHMWWVTHCATSFTFFMRGLKSREPNLRALEAHVAFSWIIQAHVEIFIRMLELALNRFMKAAVFEYIVIFFQEQWPSLSYLGRWLYKMYSLVTIVTRIQASLHLDIGLIN